MTLLVGVLCSDGVVLGADTAATFNAGGMSTVEQEFHKLFVVGNRVVGACSGEGGFGQRFRDVVQGLWDSKGFSREKGAMAIAQDISKHFLANLSDTYVFTLLNGRPLDFSAMLAFPVGETLHLCEFAPPQFQPEMKERDGLWYVSQGSGQVIADPFLGFIRSAFWDTGPPTVSEGAFAVTWALEHVVEVNPGGVKGPIDLAVLEPGPKNRASARILSRDEVGEHSETVAAAVSHLGSFRGKTQNQGDSDPMPKPPKATAVANGSKD